VTSRLRPLALLATLALLVVPAALDLPGVSRPARWLLGVAGAVGLVYLLWRVSRAFLYKVGRRLAFSYFLLGVLPIPMVALLLVITAYLLAGSFLGHLYHDGVQELIGRLESQARERLETPTDRRDNPAATTSVTEEPIALATYRRGRRVAGDPRAPETWPGWARADGDRESTVRPPILLLDDDHPTLAATAGDGDPGVIAFLDADLERTLSESTDVLVRMAVAEQPGEPAMELRIGGRGTVLKTLRPEGETDPEAERFFAARSGDGGWVDRPVIGWGLLGGPRVRLSDGTTLAEYTPVSLVTTPYQLYRHLFAASAELDAYAWVGLLGLAGLLFWIYFAAALMAIFLIYGLSSAVNRLSRATAQVQRGDFSVRIPVARRDQIGDLQRSFNAMTANLERSVASAAQKELLEKELAIARDLQQSLVPRDLPRNDRVEFAALFEPSAAIGGDYFDILRLS
jgi:HAMP domain-containing protein